MHNSKPKNPASIHLQLSGESVIPKYAETHRITFLGADHPQVIDSNMRIRTPLTDCTVTLSFLTENKKTGERAATDLQLQIPGKYRNSRMTPAVYPTPAHWHPETGAAVCFKDIKTIICSENTKHAAEEFIAFAEKISGVKLKIMLGEQHEKNTLSFRLNKELAFLGKEGYRASAGSSSILLESATAHGLIWAGRTALQLLMNGGFPSGTIEDYPTYPVRGFILDAARRPCSLGTLRKIVEFMSYFKMNDFQIHLSDNYIWLEDYADNGDLSAVNAYSAFRLESSICNEHGECATAKDYFYTKKEFHDFILWAKNEGVNIVPEIDVPAHALAFTKIFPQHMVQGQTSPLAKHRPLSDHLDISKPETIEFIKQIFDEYTCGDEPVFPRGTTVHIGADEFLSDFSAYRTFLNKIIPHIKKTNPVRLWGGLTWIKDKPETPILQSAVKDVQMDLWSSDWADGKEMYDLGYDLINAIDALLYMVPNGSGKRGSYTDLLNKKKIFREFKPNRVKIKTEKRSKYIDLPAGEHRIKGAAFSIWNDNIDRRASGLSESDLFRRFADSAVLIAEKTWGQTGKQTFKTFDRRTKQVVASFLTPQPSVFVLDPQNCICKGEAKAGRVLHLPGGVSYINTGITCANIPAELQIDLILYDLKKDQILMEADAPYGTYDIRITENGNLGFTREGYTYTFHCRLPLKKRFALSIFTAEGKTIIKIGNRKKEARGIFVHDGTIRKSNITNSTLAVPCMRIGSAVNAVHADIYALTLRS